MLFLIWLFLKNRLMDRLKKTDRPDTRPRNAVSSGPLGKNPPAAEKAIEAGKRM